VNPKVAKRIKREVYGEYSQKVREYKVVGREKYSKLRKKWFTVPVMIINVGLRAAYQKAKKEYNRKRRK